MDLYNEEIDEFVDWVSGEDVISKLDRTGFKLVSGGKIRELLQNHLRTPIIFIEDTEAGLYRVFSSEAAYDRWLENPTENSKLLLFTFARPSAYKITTGLKSETRYMAKTSSSQEESKLKYTWSIGNEEDPNYVDTLRVTYKIEKGDGNVVSYVLVYNNNNKSVEEDIYKYLTSGINTVTVSMRGSSSGASAGFTITIIVLDLLVSSNFDFSRPLQNGELLFSRNLEYIFISRNDTSIDTSVYVYVDGQFCIKKDLKEKDNQIWTEILNTWQEGYHNLLIYAEAKFNNNTFLSNVLYYKFVNSSEPKLDYFITLGTSLFGGIPPYASLLLSATLFEKFSLDWGYYTNAVQTNTSIPITWKLLDESDSVILAIHLALKGLLAEPLKFIPSIYSKNTQLYLAAYYSESQIVKIPINIIKGSSDIVETPSYDLKLDAYGKTNSSAVNDLWEFLNDNGEIITTYFNGISWDESSGWYENSFRTKGLSQQAIVNYNPFKGVPENGRTIEIEFESENVEDTSDVIIRIGSRENSRIEITPNSATLYDSNGTKRIYTNFKENERVKLAFIINGEAKSPNGQILPENKLAYIVNNGILERGADINGILFGTSSGTIVIGGSNSGVRVYSIRIYLRAITYLDAYDNFVFDSSDKTSIINRNAVIKNGNIDYDLCYNKLDTILIKGNISNLLNKNNTKEESESNVTIIRHNPFDVTGNSDFTIEGARIRKHGQSTLNYPVPSMKFWLNQKWHSDEKPTLNWEGGKTLKLAKNRYVMKDGAIPANKFVLQANYADSSGVHNGSIQRIILLSWFDAEFGNNREHKLRTDPLLFSTNETVTLTDNTVIGKNSLGYTWNHYNDSKFPYQIRIAPDSFPCVVFYLLEGSEKKIFLGLYVFMDDKKSDYIYGERSIYKFAADPFCLTESYKKQDTSTNKVWDNKDVLRIEVLTINTVLSSFNVNTRTTDIEQKIISKSSTDSQDAGVEKYRWEEDFELIYPDEDDIAGHLATDKDKNGVTYGTDTTKFGPDSEFVRKTKPFVDWLKWLSDTKYNWDKTVSGGDEKTHWEWNAGLYSSALLCFEATAPNHLDLYKLAAYYIFFLRLGLVDSVERNALLKTYDGQHWHYEPWDMDIALGNKNTGGIAFDPPIDRNSRFIDTISGNEGISYAFGGRGVDKNTGEVITSNWLWDALEGWGWWKGTVVRETAEALSKAGLNYTTLINLFDKEYADKWCELIYNENGYFKYILQRAGDNAWLNWLLGSRATHRHWWLNTSMNYYDSFWKVGNFKNHHIYIAADYTGNPNTHDLILVRPKTSTFFELSQNDEKDIEPVDSLGNITDGSASKENPALFDLVGLSFAYKVPLYLYGATYVEELDLSCLADGLDGLELGGTYSEIEGASIKILNIGTKLTPGVDENHYVGKLNTFDVNIRSGTSSEDIDIYQLGYDSLLSIHTLNMRGQKSTNFNLATLFRDYDRNLLKNFYAMGSTFENFYSSKTGNQYNDLELPGINKLSNGNILSLFTYLNLNNSSWNNLTFWNGVITGNSISLEKCNINGDYSLGIPSSLRQVVFTGTTCTHEKSKEFILNWIDCILASENNIEAIKSKQLELRNINWRGLTYSDIEHLALFNNGDNKDGKNFSGYIVLLGNELTVELLTLLKIWFGDSVFTPNSKGLVIDLESDYVRINVGGDDIELRTVDDGEGNLSNEIYLTEGGSATLNATKFLLAELVGTYNWSVRLPDTSIGGTVYKSCNIGVGADGITRLYTRQSIEGNYDVDVVCISTEGTGTAPLNSTVRIHIITATYPDSWKFNYTEVENSSNIRLAANNINFYAAGVTTEIYVEPLGEFTAGITDVKFTLTRQDNGETLIDNVSCNAFKGNDPTPIDLPNESYLVYTRLSLNKYGITLAAKGIDYGENVYYYTLTATVTYKSNSTETLSIGIMVSDDSVVLVDVNKLGLIDAISASYLNTTLTYPNENKYYKSELMTISGELDFSISQSTQTTLSFLTYKNDSVFKYLPNITSLIFDGCYYLTLTDNNIEGEDKRVLRFDKMTKVTNLSMLNCPNLSGELNLEGCRLQTLLISETNKLTMIKFSTTSSLTSVLLSDSTSDSPNLIGLAYNSGLFNNSIISSKISILEPLDVYDKSFYDFDSYNKFSYFIGKLVTNNIINNNIFGNLYVGRLNYSQYMALPKYLKNVSIQKRTWDDPFYGGVITNYISTSYLYSNLSPVFAASKFESRTILYNGSTSRITQPQQHINISSNTDIIFLNQILTWRIDQEHKYTLEGGSNNIVIYAPKLETVEALYHSLGTSYNSEDVGFDTYVANYGSNSTYNKAWQFKFGLMYFKNLKNITLSHLSRDYFNGSSSYKPRIFVLDQDFIPNIYLISSSSNLKSNGYGELTLYVKNSLISLYLEKFPSATILGILGNITRVAKYEDWVQAGKPLLTLIDEFTTTY